MTTIKILGSGCSNCKRTAKLFETGAAALGIQIQLEKVTDMATIMQYGALATPGVVIDEKLVHSGGVPSPAQIRAWLEAL